MGTSKILIDGVGIDLTQDTVAANKLLSGFKAHDSSGDAVTGSIQTWAGQEASGVKNIVSNGIFDVSQFARAAVDVPQGSMNSKTFNVTISADASGEITMVSGDSDVAAHYADANAVCALVPRFAVSKATALSTIATAGRKVAGNRGTVGLYITASLGAATFTNDGILTNSQGVQLCAYSSGNIIINISTSRILQAGDYYLVFAW